MSQIDLYTSTFAETCNLLRQYAMAREHGLALQLRSLGIGEGQNDREIILSFIKQALGDSQVSVGNKDFHVSKKGQFRIYKAQYNITDINGQTETISVTDKQEQIIRDLFNNVIQERTDDWEKRLRGLITEEAGLTLLDRGLKSLSQEKKLDQELTAKSSSNWKWDAELNISGMWEDPLTQARMGFLTTHLEHKDNLKYFHFGTKTIPLDTTRFLSSDNVQSVYTILKNILVYDRLQGNYPIYYSVNTKEILLSSDILAHPENFFYVEPKHFTLAEILKMARAIKEKMDKDEIETMKEEQFNIYTKEIWAAITKASFRTTLWYGK